MIINARVKLFSQALSENKLALSLLIFFIMMMCLIALAPISKTDELHYYYYFLKRIVSEGGILFDYYQVLSFQPMAQQLWYVPVYGLDAIEAPALLNVFTSFLIIFFSYLWLTKYIDRKLAYIAILATYINLNGISIYPAPQDNVACWLWGLLSLIATYEFLYSNLSLEKRKYILLTLGMIYVTACLVKLSNLPLVFLCICIILIKLFIDKIHIKYFLLLLFPFIIFYIPFLVRIYLWTGSPFFPALANLFGSNTFDVDALNIYLQRPAPQWRDSIIDNLYYIIDMFRHNILFNLSPILILFSQIGVFILFYKKKYFIAVIASFYMIFMFFSSASLRLMGGHYIFLTLILFIQDIKFFQKPIILNLIRMHSIFLVILTVIYFKQFGMYIFGIETKEEFLQTKVQTYQEIQWANRNLPSNSKILTTTYDKYYFDFSVYNLAEYPLAFGKDLRTLKSIEEIYLFLINNGITHLFLAETGIGFNRDFRKLLLAVADKYGNILYQDSKAIVHGVRHPLFKHKTGNLKIYSLNE